MAVLAEFSFPVPAATSLRQRSFGRLVFALDEQLRRRSGVIDFVDQPDCILRLKIDRMQGEIVLSDGVRLCSGDRVVELHFRNETFPAMTREGATIGWAREATKRMDHSLRELSKYLVSRSELGDVEAVRAVMPVLGEGQRRQIERIASRFGFEFVPEADPPPMRRRLGQNAVGLLLVLASNPKAASIGVLRRGGAPLYISRRKLADRYRAVGVSRRQDRSL
jgi:hypothetical protein